MVEPESLDKWKRTHYTTEVPKKEGESVVLAGWAREIRDMGKLNFIVLADREGIIQITAKNDEVPKEILESVPKIPRESVIAVKGKVRTSKQAPGGREIVPEEIKILNKSDSPLPLEITGRTPALLDTKLDWRVLDLRTDETKAIFKIQAQITKSFREFLIEKGYLEIQAPVIIASASEGGADLFSIPYFEKEAFLAQSPQLYKQMCAISLEKVFTIMPIFRAEKFNTPTHLNEIRQMDVEQAYADDEDVMKVLEQVFSYVLKQVRENREEELKILKRDLRIPKLPLKRVTYTEAIEMLKKKGEKISWGEDFTKTQEKILCELIGEEAFFVKDWPTKIKAFYAMPYEKDPKICHAFDLIYSGLEICSGTQRIHMPDLLIKQLKSKDLEPNMFKSYIDCFRYGTPMHSGWSIGLERLTMTIAGKSNIRECCMFPRDRNRITP